LQVVPLAVGQTLNLGDPMSWPVACAVSKTPMLAAFVLQTQTTKLALAPGATSDADRDWVRTHSCGVIGAGAEDVGELLGVGVGVGVLALMLGSGLGVGVGVADVVSDGAGVELSVGVGVGLSVGDGVEVSAGDGAEVSDGDGDGAEVSDGDGVALSDGDGVEVSDGAGAVLLVTMAVSTAVFGGAAHAVFVLVMGTIVASAIMAWPNTPKPRMLNPAAAPSAARLTIRALTRATSL
jgi:hypothetical protein